MKGIDTSSYQAPDLTDLIASYDPDVVVVKMYLPVEVISQTHSIAQSRSVLTNRKLLTGYCYCYGSVDPTKTVAWAATLADYCGASIRGEFPAAHLWLDMEDTDAPDDLWLAKAAGKAEEMGVSLGIYTGRYWWRQHMNNDWSYLPLWLANYDEDPSLDSFIPFGGWTYLTGKQYTSTPIDQNTFLDGGVMPRTPEQQRIIDVLRVNANARLEQLKAAADTFNYNKLAGELSVATAEINGEVDKLEILWPV